MDIKSKHLWEVLNLNDGGFIWRLLFTWKLSTNFNSMLEEKIKKKELKSDH